MQDNQYLNKIKFLYTNDFFFVFSEIIILIALLALLILMVYLSEIKKGLFLNLFEFWMSFFLFVFFITFYITLNLITINFSLFDLSFTSNSMVYCFKIIFFIFFIFFLIIVKSYSNQINLRSPEFIFLVIFSVLGLIFLMHSNDFLIAYLSLEMYGLTISAASAIFRKNIFQLEASFKYFLLNCVTSGFILFSISIVYSLLGSINFYDLKIIMYYENFTNVTGAKFLILIISFFIIINLFVKLGVAPFHNWLIDIYAGFSYPILLFVSILTKISLICFLIRLVELFFVNSLFLKIFFIIIIFFNIIYGSFGSVMQIKLKKFIGFSSVTNNSFIVACLLIGGLSGSILLVFFSLFYFASLFAIISVFMLLFNNSTSTSIKKFTGLLSLYSYQPKISIILSFLIFNIASLPPFVGFMGKFFIFSYLGLDYFNFIYLIFVMLSFNIAVVFYYIRLNKIIFTTHTNNYLFFKPFSFYHVYIVLVLVMFLLLSSLCFVNIFDIISFLLKF